MIQIFEKTKKHPNKPLGHLFISGAAIRIRTGDPFLTMEVLYLLSHSSNY